MTKHQPKLPPDDSISVDVDRGPNWLFLKVHRPAAETPAPKSRIADQLWSIAAKHFTYRVVLEMEDFESLPKTWSADIAQLQERLEARGGSLKICGLTDAAQLSEVDQQGKLAPHSSRDDAIMGRVDD